MSVYCLLVELEIDEQDCVGEQEARACSGCTSRFRRCTHCREIRVIVDAKRGICQVCLPTCSEACRKRKPVSVIDEDVAGNLEEALARIMDEMQKTAYVKNTSVFWSDSLTPDEMMETEKVFSRLSSEQVGMLKSRIGFHAAPMSYGTIAKQLGVSQRDSVRKLLAATKIALDSVLSAGLYKKFDDRWQGLDKRRILLKSSRGNQSWQPSPKIQEMEANAAILREHPVLI